MYRLGPFHDGVMPLSPDMRIDVLNNSKNTSNATPASAWAPFAYSAFTLLWVATLVSNIGTWVHNAGAAWLMTTLDSSPAIVALIQAATALPVFCFALFAGTLADRVDKQRFLAIVNIVLAAVTFALAVLVALDWMTPIGLLAFTFLIGTGAAFMAPAWQAIVPDLVPRENLQPAIALNGLGINISRAIGPALAGVLIISIGLAAPFVVNAASYLVIIGALLAWKQPPTPARTLPPEPLLGGMLTGVRHASHNAALKATLMRALGYFAFASAYWALLPLVARAIPGGGAGLYGTLLAAVGAGAVVGALALPKIRTKLNTNILQSLGAAVTAVGMAGLGLATSTLVAVPASFLGGLGWIAVLTSLNVSAQTALPNWVRARGLAIFIMVFFGCMAAGSIIWGQVATYTSVTTTLLAAAVGALVAIPLTWRSKLGQGEHRDLTPAMSWGAPIVADTFDDDPDRGPVLVTISYVIDAQASGDFLQAIHALSAERYRNGAYSWGVYQDAAQPGIWIEWFFLSSWAEHLRQHERVTRHDQDIHDTVSAYHVGDASPEVRHYLASARAEYRS